MCLSTIRDVGGKRSDGGVVDVDVGDGVGLNISIQNTHEIIIKADEQQIFLIPHIFLWVIFRCFCC